MGKAKIFITTMFLFILIIFSTVKAEAAASVERFGGDNRYDTAVR